MGLKLQTKLFFAFIFATASVTLGVALFVNWNFDRGFREYLNQAALERTSPVIETVVSYYQAEASWNELRGNQVLWERLLRQSFLRDRTWRGDGQHEQAKLDAPPGVKDERLRRRHNKLKHSARKLGRIRLYDADKTAIIGPEQWRKKDLVQPVYAGQQLIAYMVIHPVSIRTNRLGNEFRQQQLQSLSVVVAVVIAVSALLAWLLARHLIAPIRAITQGAKSLSGGDYQARVSVEGNDELAHLAGDFNQLALALERNEQSRQQWIADISHELRTPLAVLQGEIEAVVDGVRELNERSVLSLHSEVLSLSKLVDDLYQLALSDVGALDYRFEIVPVNDILLLSVDAFSRRIDQAQLSLSVQGLDTLSSLARLDSRRMQQLFNNLLENAIRYTDAGGRIELSASEDNDQIYLRLQDTGPGVSDEDLEKIFERLYRVDQSRSREHGGSGLGLALCQNIIEAHGGRIQAEHSALGGVAIIITLAKHRALD